MLNAERIIIAGMFVVTANLVGIIVWPLLGNPGDYVSPPALAPVFVVVGGGFGWVFAPAIMRWLMNTPKK